MEKCYSWVCTECNIKFCNKYALKRHWNQKHRNQKCDQDSKFFECTHCNKQFNYRNDIVRHLKNRELNSWVCTECGTGATFCNKYVLMRHIKQKHRPNDGKCSESFGSYFRCVECHAEFSSRTTIIQHYDEAHQIPIVTENLSFLSIDDFEDWKSEMQRETITQFRKRNQYITLRTIVKFYICNRTGLYHSSIPTEERKRLLKTCGYKQIGGYCPAQIKVVEYKDKCAVEFCHTHVGHEVGDERALKYIYLEKHERLRIAQQIRNGVSAHQILRAEIGNPENDRSKLKRMCNKDIRNIAVAYNLTFEGRRRSRLGADLADAEDFLVGHKDAVLYYKKAGVDDENDDDHHRHVFGVDDFALVLMNETQERLLRAYAGKLVAMEGVHKTNHYGYVLHSLLVAGAVTDGECVPVAFALSNRADEAAVAFFLARVRDRVGVVETETFVSDGRAAYYDGWLSVMREPKSYFFSTWHVNDTWQKRLNAAVKDEAVRRSVRATLDEMWREPNPLIFEEKLSTFLSARSHGADDEGVARFVDYFCANFSKIAPLWAHCYRQHANANVVAAVEVFRQNLEHQVAKRRKIKSLSQLLRYVYEYVDARATKNERKRKSGSLCDRLTWLRRKHVEALEERIDVIPVNDEFFLAANDFTVTKSAVKECGNAAAAAAACNLSCTLCDLCFHEYKCSCGDSAISNNMCKHIHAVGMYLKNGGVDDPISASVSTPAVSLYCSVDFATDTTTNPDYSADASPSHTNCSVDSAASVSRSSDSTAFCTAATATDIAASPPHTIFVDVGNITELDTMNTLKQQMMEEFAKSLDAVTTEDNVHFIREHFINPIVPAITSLNTRPKHEPSDVEETGETNNL